MPPKLVRRVLIAPVVPAITVLLVPLFPLWLIAAAAVSPWLPGRWRPLRILLVALVYLVLESLALIAAFVIWIASGFGIWMRSPAFVTGNYAVLRGLLRGLVAAGRRAFNLRIESGEPVGGEGPLPAPLIVLCRHAGPGDSFLLVHWLLCEEGLRPRIVLKDTMQWEPAVDVLLNRLPSEFISPNPEHGEDVAARIGELAAGMGPRGALVIFPEGGNFTPKRRLHSISKLEEKGLTEEAELARQMRNVMAPRPRGTIAALDSAPEGATSVLVAHTGLEDLSSAVDLWRGLPMDSEVRAHAWLVRPEELPCSDEAKERWLYEWWKRIDSWIGAERRSQSRAPR